MPSSNVTINDMQEVPTRYLAHSGPGPWPLCPQSCISSRRPSARLALLCLLGTGPSAEVQSGQRRAAWPVRPRPRPAAERPCWRPPAAVTLLPASPLLPAFLSPSPERPSSGPRQSPGPRVLSSRLRRDLSHYRAGGWARTLEALQLPGHPLWLSRLPTSDSASPCLVPLPPRRGLLAVGKVMQVGGRRRGCA